MEEVKLVSWCLLETTDLNHWEGVMRMWIDAIVCRYKILNIYMLHCIIPEDRKVKIPYKSRADQSNKSLLKFCHIVKIFNNIVLKSFCKILSWLFNKS